MAETPAKPDGAEKAYAAAASEVKPAAPKAVAPKAKPAPAKAKPKPAPKAKSKPVAGKSVKPAAKAPQPAPEPELPAPVEAAVNETAAAVAAPEIAAPEPSAIEPTAKPETTVITESKEPEMETMDTVTTPDYSSMLSEMQSKAKEAYDKGTASVGEATEFAKGNVEALVESGKIFAGGMQDMGKTVVDEAKSAYETMTADMKEMAAVKSPTELFQLQGKIMRRNFDALVATSSKNTEAMMKLANDSFAPLSGRMNMAAEKMSKVA